MLVRFESIFDYLSCNRGIFENNSYYLSRSEGKKGSNRHSRNYPIPFSQAKCMGRDTTFKYMSEAYKQPFHLSGRLEKW